jgi:hypothetical protein
LCSNACRHWKRRRRWTGSVYENLESDLQCLQRVKGGILTISATRPLIIRLRKCGPPSHVVALPTALGQYRTDCRLEPLMIRGVDAEHLAPPSQSSRIAVSTAWLWITPASRMRSFVASIKIR